MERTEQMEQRTSKDYMRQPSILRYCLKAQDPKAPEVMAIALAITNRRNATLKPEYRNKVYIHGQVGNPPASNPEIKDGDWVETTFIEGVFFERVYMDGYATLDCYIKTVNTNYRLYDSEKNRLTWMHFLLQDIEERDLKFGDFTEYFSDINTDFTEVRVTGS